MVLVFVPRGFSSGTPVFPINFMVLTKGTYEKAFVFGYKHGSNDITCKPRIMKGVLVRLCPSYTRKPVCLFVCLCCGVDGMQSPQMPFLLKTYHFHVVELT